MRGFSDEERDRIREELIETCRDLLVRYGPEKTNVADVTEAVGIAKGTFYRFFDSKYDLYLVILRREQRAYLEHLERELERTDTAREGLETLFRTYLAWIEENELVQQTVVRGDYDAVLRGVADERIEAVQREGLAEFVPVVEGVRERSDALAGIDATTILGLTSAVSLLALHRDAYEEFEEGYYERVTDVYVSALAAGLASGEVD